MQVIGDPAALKENSTFIPDGATKIRIKLVP